MWSMVVLASEKYSVCLSTPFSCHICASEDQPDFEQTKDYFKLCKVTIKY